MPRLGKGWKELGLDNSPVRAEPTDPKRVAEMEAGRRVSVLTQWTMDGRLVYDAGRHGYVPRGGGMLFPAEDIMDDTVFANMALAAQAVGGDNG